MMFADTHKTFGGVDHYDESCSGTLSIQLQADKRWRLWTPFDLGSIPAHTRFDGVVREGEILIYGPGLYHYTTVLPTEDTAGGGLKKSIATPFYFGNFPWF